MSRNQCQQGKNWTPRWDVTCGSDSHHFCGSVHIALTMTDMKIGVGKVAAVAVPVVPLLLLLLLLPPPPPPLLLVVDVIVLAGLVLLVMLRLVVGKIVLLSCCLLPRTVDLFEVGYTKGIWYT